MRNRFAIIMPVYNRSWVLENALQSVAEQIYRPIQLIIADNGSTDNSKQIASDFKKKNCSDDFEIILTEEKKAGACAARNRGLKEVDADYLMFFDDDDLLAPDAVSRIMHVFATQGPDIVGFTATYKSGITITPKKSCFSTDPVDQINHCMLATQCFAVKTNLLKKTGTWDEDLMRWQDWNFGIRILLTVPSVIWIKRPALVVINRHCNSISGNGFLHSEKELEKTILKTIMAVNESRHPLKERYKKLIYCRLLILAAQYRREGDKNAAKRALMLYLHNIPMNVPLKLFSYIIYTYIILGGRGAGQIFKKVFL
ncbi:MAG: glycosyltransferase [Bacteroidales bacterium]